MSLKMSMVNQKYEWSIKGKIGKVIFKIVTPFLMLRVWWAGFFYEPSIQKNMKHWPFNVVEDGKPKIRVEYPGENR
jgi:hypothetical protein